MHQAANFETANKTTAIRPVARHVVDDGRSPAGHRRPSCSPARYRRLISKLKQTTAIRPVVRHVVHNVSKLKQTMGKRPVAHDGR